MHHYELHHVAMQRVKEGWVSSRVLDMFDTHVRSTWSQAVFLGWPVVNSTHSTHVCFNHSLYACIVTQTTFCDSNLFLSQKLFSVKQTCFRHRILFLWQNPFSVTDLLLLLKNLVCVTKICFFWQKLVSVEEICFCGKHLFLWQKVVSVTETSFCAKNWYRNIFVSKINTFCRLLTRNFNGKVSVENWSFCYLG